MDDYRRTKYCPELDNVRKKKEHIKNKIKEEHPRAQDMHTYISNNSGSLKKEFMKIYNDKCAYCGVSKESQPSLTQEAKPKKKPIIICGDFNVAATELDLKNPKNNVKNVGFTPEEREKFKTLLDSGFTDSYRYLHPDTEKYSWWSYRFKARERNAGWRIDYFLTSDSIKDKIKDAEILTDVMGSDHCPIELDIDI